MQKISVCEFKHRLMEAPADRVILDSVNQEWSDADNTMRIKLFFDKIIVNLNPNTILLQSPCSMVWFHGVKYVEAEEKSLLGSVYNIVCMEPLQGAVSKSYRIVVS